ncbi:MAG: hypothetical protein ABIH59_01885 [archaeon]
MVYKRYIYKNGKKIGPYYYESKKVNGKVVSTYLGSTPPPDYKKNKTKRIFKSLPNKNLILVGVLILFAITLINFLFVVKIAPTGEISLLVEQDHLAGEILTGNIILTMKKGELIPANTNVLINNSGEQHPYLLENLLTGPTIQGDFFIRNQNLSGSGSGFGVAGETETYPNVSFTLRITRKKILPVPEGSLPPEQPSENLSNFANVSYEMLAAPPEKKTYYDVDGIVSKNSAFQYVLEKGETARVISSSQPVDLFVLGPDLTVTTNYSELTPGFGLDYLIDQDVQFSFDLDSLNIVAIEGELKISFTYDNKELVSATKTIGPGTEEPINITINTIQEQAILNKNVKWYKNIKLPSIRSVKVSIPLESVNIKAYKSGQEISISAQDKPNFKEITIDDDALEYDLEYETTAPSVAQEEVKTNKKIIKIIGSLDPTIHYEDVLANTNLPESLSARNPSRIKIYWIEQDTYVSPISIEDLDDNGIFDYIEWIVPSLSNQTFEIIIIGAEHLDSSRAFISDIYGKVNQTDNITYTIPENEYARAYFETTLTNENFIDVYIKEAGPATIEVYEKDSEIIIGSINVNREGVYYINLDFEGQQEVFDLKSSRREIIYDYIHDAKPGDPRLVDNVFSENINILEEGQTLTISSQYQNYNVDRTGNWVIQLESTDTNSLQNDMDGVCSAGEGFKITNIMINTCGRRDTCTPSIALGTIDLTLSKNAYAEITWTLEACPGASNQDPYTITTRRISGDTALLNDVTNSIVVNPAPANQPPTIDLVGPLPATIDPIEDNIQSVIFNVQISDPDGYTDITSVTADFDYDLGGEPTRSDSLCNFISGSLNTATYECTVDMWYYDAAGDWTATIIAQDSGGLSDTDNSGIFVYQTLIGMIIPSPIGALEWLPLNPGANNVLSNNHPIVIENTGNYEGQISVIAYDLEGENIGGEFITANNFWVDPVEASACGSGTILQNANPVTIISSTLPRASDSGISTEEIYFCIPLVPPVSAQPYSTTPSGESWTVSLV